MASSTGQARFLALGDSYTIGEGVEPADRWPRQLTSLLRAQGVEVGEPEIIARTGWTTDELDAAITVEAPAGPYALVSLLIGVNNQYRGRDIGEYREHLGGLLSRAISFARGDASRVLVLSIPDWGVTPFAAGRDGARIRAEIDAFNAVCRDLADVARCRYVDTSAASRAAASDASLIADDGLHPSAKLYRQWAEAALPAAVAALRT